MKNKYFHIKVLPNKQVIVFSTTYLSPLKFLDQIEKDLAKSIEGKHEIIFDFLLSNGNNSNRYAKALFDGQKFVKGSFKYIEVPSKSSLRNISAQYYKEHSNDVDFTFAGKIIKNLILKGITI